MLSTPTPLSSLSLRFSGSLNAWVSSWYMTKLSLLSLMMRHKQARAPVKAMDRDRNITSSSVLSAPLPSSL